MVPCSVDFSIVDNIVVRNDVGKTVVFSVFGDTVVTAVLSRIGVIFAVAYDVINVSSVIFF